MLLSRLTGSVSSGNLLTFDVERFVEELEIVGIFRVKVVNTHLRMRRVFYVKSLLSDSADAFQCFSDFQYVSSSISNIVITCC